MPQTTRQKIENGVKIFATCVYISAVIYLIAVITEAYTKYVLTVKDLSFQILFSILAIAFFGFLIFIIVMVSKPFRRYLFKAFGEEK
jgi:glucan phosphoethanolaminetransferase (alkaline phosphatase superfamily)